jgi:hypothetical protein
MPSVGEEWSGRYQRSKEGDCQYKGVVCRR